MRRRERGGQFSDGSLLIFRTALLLPLNESQLDRRTGKDARCPFDGATAMGLARLKRTNTSFAVFSMRVFGLWSLWTAFAASLVSRKRFGTFDIAPKTSSERILSSRDIEGRICEGKRLSFHFVLLLQICSPNARPNGESSNDRRRRISYKNRLRRASCSTAGSSGAELKGNGHPEIFRGNKSLRPEGVAPCSILHLAL
jgi:hypothetical protein